MKRKCIIFLLLFMAMLYIAPIAAEFVQPGTGVAWAEEEKDVNAPVEQRDSRYYTIFPDDRWPKVMFFYNSLALLCGGFLVMTIVRSGYSYMGSAANPGMKASFAEDIQRCFVAMAIIALAPVLIKLIIGVNDGLVHFIAQIVNASTADLIYSDGGKLTAAGMFEKVIAAPFKIFTDLFKYVFGLNSVDTLVFNGNVDILKNLGEMDTGNVFANAILNLSLVGFEIYFNAIYTIRKYVVTVIFIATPIIVGIWTLTTNRQVIEIWLAEIFQTVFVQTAHALSMGVFMTVLLSSGSAGVVDGSWLNDDLVKVSLWVAGFGGAICTLMVVMQGYKIMTANGERDVAEAKNGLLKAVIGLGILGTAALIAGYIATLASGKWY